MTQQHVMPRWFRWAGVVAFVLIVIALVAVPSGGRLYAEPAGAVTMKIEPATRAVPVNGTTTLQVKADISTGDMDATGGLGAYEFDLNYNKDYLQVTNVADAGELTGPNTRTAGQLGPNIDNATGQTADGAYSYDATNPLIAGPKSTESPVALANVTLQATRAGVTTVNLANALMTDVQANAWPDGVGNTLNVSGAKVWSIVSASFHFSDFNGDTWEDPAIWDPVSLKWKWLASDGAGGFATQMTTLRFGRDVSIPLTGDINGDGYTDLILWDTDTQRWRVKRSNGSGGYIKTMRLKFGLPDATPVVADFNHDTLDDICTWDSVKKLRCKPFNGTTFGATQTFNLRPGTAIPLVGDFNGDGWEDPAIWDPVSHKWKWLASDGIGGFATQMTTLRFGRDVSVSLTGDINGDGYTDLILWDTDTQRWRIKRSNGSGGYVKTMRFKFGLPGAIPVVADFNHDGLDDIGTWDPVKKLRWKPFNGTAFGATQTFNLRPGNSVPLQ